MKTRTLICLVFVWSIWLAVGPTTASAQFNSAIEGTITDPSGAGVPGAKITIKNLGTAQEETVTSSASGDYPVQLATGCDIQRDGLGGWVWDHDAGKRDDYGVGDQDRQLGPNRWKDDHGSYC